MKQTLKQLKALADPIRLKVVRTLMKKDTYVSGLRRVTRAESTLLSHHLAVLKSAGLAVDRRDGKRKIYSIGPICNNNYITLKKFDILFK